MQGSDDPVKVAEEHNDERFDKEKEKTADFMVYAADLHLNQIQVGELAVGNATGKGIKRMAQKATAAHRKMFEELKTTAETMQVILPSTLSDERKKDCDQLGKKEGKDFDKDYCKMMVQQHEKALRRFEKEAESGKDEMIRQWAFAKLPALRTTLDNALECEKNDGRLSDTLIDANEKDSKAKEKELEKEKVTSDGKDKTAQKQKNKTDW
jgi:putative membrane protein